MTDPYVIRRPKKVNRDLVWPLLDPPSPEDWQQPLWGPGCALADGKGPWAALSASQKAVLKPGKRRTVYAGETVTEPLSAGSNYTALICFMRACFRAGWYPWQCAHLLDLKREVGPGAYFYWLSVRSTEDDWFEQLWERVALSENSPHWKNQVQGGIGNRTYRGGSINTYSSESTPKPFVIHESKLDELRRWVVTHPGLSQSEIKAQAPLNGRVVVKYLEELERRGLASFESVRLGRGGKPRKVWTAVYTAVELKEFEVDRIVADETRGLVFELLTMPAKAAVETPDRKSYDAASELRARLPERSDRGLAQRPARTAPDLLAVHVVGSVLADG
jgi:hypothetical protein